MKILFVYPHTLGHGDIPIGLTVLTAVLRKAGHAVKVFDCSFFTNKEYVLLQKENFGMVKPSPKPPVSPPCSGDFTDMERELKAMATDFQPDILGITATTAIYPLGLRCCRIVKSIRPQTISIFGGIHPTICPEEVIADDGVDMLCIGEGEGAMIDLCDALEHNKSIESIKNLWFKHPNSSGKIVRNELRPFLDMNTLPVPDFQDFAEYSLYRPFDGQIYRMMHAELSRGCVFDCSYCANQFLQESLKSCGRYHRRKEPAFAVQQLKELKERFDFNLVRFWDEDFTAHPMEYIKTFAELYKKQVDLPFLVYAGTRSINKEKVDCLKEMGCVTLAIGIESGSYWLRKYILNRNITNEQILEKFAIAKGSGIRISTYNMIGIPFETREMVFETIELNRQVGAETSTVGPFKPFPKTRLSNLAYEYGMVQQKPDFLLLKSEMNTPHMSAAEIDGLVRTFSFYVKLPKHVWPLLETCENDAAIAERVLPTLLV